MSLAFEKMQAQGNDFVIINTLQQPIPEIDEPWIKNLCDRRYGIGCDQLLILKDDAQAHASVRIFNADGSEAANCGNGLRCAGSLLMKFLNKSVVMISLADRTVTVSESDDLISVEMGSALVEQVTPAHVDVSIGNPHSVFFEAVESFPENRNIEIITGQIADHAYIDIIERGAGRTLACGSGACAVATAIWHQEKHQRPLTIEMPGGTVIVKGSPENITLSGSVTHVFSGVYSD